MLGGSGNFARGDCRGGRGPFNCHRQSTEQHKRNALAVASELVAARWFKVPTRVPSAPNPRASRLECGVERASEWVR